MVSANTQTHDIEPTPEFDEKCRVLVRRWQTGDLPLKEALATISNYSHEAIAAGHLANQARAEHLMGYIQHYRGSLNISIQHYERARSLFIEVGNRNRVATMDLNQGENYRFKGDFNRALRLYRSAYQIAKDFDNVRVQAIAAVNEGLVLLAVGQNTNALSAFEVGLELATEWPEDSTDLGGLLCELHHGMAVAHLRQHNYDAAWEQARQALEIAASTREPHQLGYANRIVGEVITEMKIAPDPELYTDPDDYFRAAMDAFKEMNAEAELARTMYAHALSLAQRNKRTMAARKLQQVMIIFTRLGMVDDAARAAEAQLAVL